MGVQDNPPVWMLATSGVWRPSAADMFNSAEDFSAWFGAPLQALRDGGAAAQRGGAWMMAPHARGKVMTLPP